MLLEHWTCGTTFLNARLPRYTARIYELRKAGYYVDRRKCANPSHSHESPQWEWRILAAPGYAEGDPCPGCGSKLSHVSTCAYRDLVEAEGTLFVGGGPEVHHGAR